MAASFCVGREKTVDLIAHGCPERTVEALGGRLASIESSRIFAEVLDSGLSRIKTIGAKHALAVVNDVGELQDGEWLSHGVSWWLERGADGCEVLRVQGFDLCHKGLIDFVPQLAATGKQIAKFFL
jgi:hypothetical protein